MRTRKTIEAVTLDAGGTLIEPWPSVGCVYAEVAAGFGVKAAADELSDRFGAVWRGKRDFDYSREAWYALVRGAFGGQAPELPGEFFPAVYDRFAQPDVWRVQEDVVPALENLAGRGVPLGIVSNWDERLRPLLQALKLDRYFDAIIVSWEVGFTKPSPVIFEVASRKLGVRPQNILHVGDGEHDDFDGARRADMQALLLRRGRAFPPTALSERPGVTSLLDIETHLFGNL